MVEPWKWKPQTVNENEKVIDTVSFDDIMWKDIKEKLIAFYKDFHFRNFFRK